MFTLNGTYNFAHVMAKTIEDTAKVQIEAILNKKAFKDCQIRIMADVHAGKGCTVGYTATLGENVVPNLVGCDLNCGLLAYNLGPISPDFQGLDDFIKVNIPSGMTSRLDLHEILYQEENLNFVPEFERLRLKISSGKETPSKTPSRVLCSIGTLGGG
jgi:RNA-splicing ligase RtcB